MEFSGPVILNTTVEENSKSLTMLTILQVAAKMKLQDFAAAKKWLEKKNVPIYKETKTLFVYEIDVDVAIDKIRIKDLRNQYPNKWQEIYKRIAKDNSVYEMVVLSLCGEIISKPITKLKLTSQEDESLYNQLIS